MIKIKKLIYLVFGTIALLALFIGCGSDGIDDVYRMPEDILITDYSVQAVDDPIINAVVTSDTCTGYEERTDGYYILTGCSAKPRSILIEGGFVDLNGDGIQQDENETNMGMPLMLNTAQVDKDSTSFAVTPLTTLVANAESDEEIEEIANAFDITKENLYKAPGSENNISDILRSLNVLLIDAKEYGIENQLEFLKDFRKSIKEAKEDNSSSTGADLVAASRKNLAEKANDPIYIRKYGVVFSGFVTSQEYDDTETLLQGVANAYKVPNDEVVFSGFIYDDIITDANISIYYYMESNGSKQEVGTAQTDENASSDKKIGKWTIEIESKVLDEDRVLVFEGKAKVGEKDIILNSAISTIVLREMYQSRINTADLKDVTITNITTAKLAILKQLKSDILTAAEGAKEIIEKKQIIEQNPKVKAILKSTSAAIKAVIDKNETMSIKDQNITDTVHFTDLLTAKIIGGVFTGDENISKAKADDVVNESELEEIALTIKTTITNEANISKTVIEETEEEINNDKTLSDQLLSTVYKKFKVDDKNLLGISLVVKIDDEEEPLEINFFDNKTFTLHRKDNGGIEQIIGNWSVTDTGDLNVSYSEGYYKVSFSSLTQSSRGNFKHYIDTNITESNNFTILNIKKFDKDKMFPPLLEFDNNLLQGKSFYEVYFDINDTKYQDRRWEFDTNSVYVNPDATSNNNDGITPYPYTLSNGELTFNNKTYKIVNSFEDRILCDNNVTIYYSPINAAAAMELKNYEDKISSTSLHTSLIPWVTSGFEGINTHFLSDNILILNAKPKSDDDFSKSYTAISNSSVAPDVIGTQTEIEVSQNNGNSDRQRGYVRVDYALQSCDIFKEDGKLSAFVLIKGSKVQFILKQDDTKILSNATMVEENTIGKKYKVMIFLVKNKLVIVVDDGIKSNYQYVDLEKLDLGAYKLPNKISKISTGAGLWTDGTDSYKDGKLNAPVQTKIYSFKTISNDGETTYYPTGENNDRVCPATPVTSEDKILSGITWEQILKDERYTVEGNEVSFTGDSIRFITVKNDNNRSRTEVKTDFSPLKNSVSITAKLIETSAYTQLKLKTFSDIVISDSLKTDLNLSSNNVVAGCSIVLKGKTIYANVYLEDPTGKEVKVYDSRDSMTMFYNPNNADLIGKNVNLTIANIDNSVVFSASTDGVTINSATFTRPAGVEWYGIKSAKIRTEILDDYANSEGEEAADSMRAEVYSVSTIDYVAPVTEFTYDMVAGNTVYSIAEDKSNYSVITYAQLGINTREITKDSLEHSNPITQSYTIVNGVINVDADYDFTVTLLEKNVDGKYNLIKITYSNGSTHNRRAYFNIDDARAFLGLDTIFAYTSNDFIKVPDNIGDNYFVFKKDITTDEYNAQAGAIETVYSKDLYRLAYDNGIKVTKASFENDELKFISVADGTTVVYNVGSYTLSDGKLTFANEEREFAGEFDATLLNDSNGKPFKDGSKAYAFNIKTTTDEIDYIGDTGYSNIQSYLESNDTQKYNIPVYFGDSNITVGIAPVDTNLSYPTEVDINSSSITSTEFNNTAAGDISTIVGKTLYDLEYREEWSESLQKKVFGNNIESIQITTSQIIGTDIADPSGSLDDNWEDNITISNNVITEKYGKFRLKFVETVNASTITPNGLNIFSDGTAYKVMLFRDQDQFEWRDDSWAYPTYYENGSDNNFTDIQQYIEFLKTNQDNFGCGGYDHNNCYTFTQDANISDGNGTLVDAAEAGPNPTIIGTWEYSDGILKTNITNPNYWWDNSDPWMPTLRINPSNNYVQKGEYGPAGVGDKFYLFDETAKNEWVAFFDGTPKAGELIKYINGQEYGTAGTWARMTVDGKDAIVTNIDQTIYNGDTPMMIENNGTLQYALLRPAGDTIVRYLFDENAKNDWVSYFGPYTYNAEVNSMFVNVTETADLDDAKTAVSNIRDLAYSLYKDDNGTESGLIIDQDSLITNKIQSLIEEFDSDINATSKAISTLADDFSNKVELDLNNTMNEIDSRLSYIEERLRAIEDTNITAVTLFTEDTNDTNKTITFVRGVNDLNETVLVSASNASLSGTGYNLNISSLEFNWDELTRTATFTANTTASISANDTTFTGNLSIDGNYTESSGDGKPSDIEKLIFTFNGNLTSDSRVLDGNISIDAINGNYTINGKLTGKTGEPTIEGSLSANISLLDLDKINGEDEVQWGYMDYYDSDYFPIVLKDLNGNYRLMKDWSTTIDGESLSAYYGEEYNAENYIFRFTITDTNGTSYSGYLENFNINYGYINYGIESDDHEYHINLDYYDGNFIAYYWEDNQEYSINVSSVSVEPIEKIKFEKIPQSYVFKGSVLDGDNSVQLELYANKPTLSNEGSIMLKSVNFSNDKVALTLENMSIQSNETRIDSYKNKVETSFSIDSLKGTVTDTDGTALSLEINGTVQDSFYNYDWGEDEHDVLIMDINTSYSYGDTKFAGRIETNFSNIDADDYFWSDKYGVYKKEGYSRFTGTIEANNFTPFEVVVDQKFSPTSEKYESISAIIKRDNYTMAIRYLQEYNEVVDPYGYTSYTDGNETIEFVDSNGVVSKDTGLNVNIINLKNINGDNLGTINFDTKWYSDPDGNGETIF